MYICYINKKQNKNMNYELKLKYRKILKEEYLKGKITEKEYLKCLEDLRPKKQKETFIQKIKKLF